MPRPDGLSKLFYTLPHFVVTAQKKPGKNAKSGEETKTLSHFSKSDIRYSSDVSPAKVLRVTGIVDIPGSGVQGCSYGSRRGFFPLQTSNKAAASANARDIYVCLAPNGWEVPLARSRKPKAIAQEGDSEQSITVGQFLDAIFRTATTQRTIEGYATAVSQNR